MATTQNESRLPLTIEDISTEWLSSGLSVSTPGVRVNNFDIVNVRHGFTTVIRLHVDLNDEGVKAGIGPSIILKGGFEEHSPSRSRTYAIEALSYRDLWPELGLNVPKVYFADVEPEHQQTMMIMEDLLARDVRFCNPFQPHTPEQAKLYLSALAQLHSKTWNSPDIGPGGRWESTHRFEYNDLRWSGVANNGNALLRDYMVEFGYFAPDVWQRFIELPRSAAVSVHLQDGDWLREALDHCVALMEVLPRCITHGDMHLGNLYWDADGTPGFFDPIPRIEPAHWEVAYYLTCSLDPADRREWDRVLVAHYLDELSRHGVDAPDIDEMMHYFAIFLTYGLIVFIINENFYQTESFNTVHAMRHSVAMTEHNSKQVITESIRSDPYLKGRGTA